LEVDVAFVEWILDPDTPLLEKGMKGLIKRYKELTTEVASTDELTPEVHTSSKDSLSTHIRTLVSNLGLKFIKPKTVDLCRIRIFDALNNWWHDSLIKETICKVDPRLLFNADETGVARIIDSAEKVLCIPGEKSVVPTQECGGNHVTVFPIINAQGCLMTPHVILHCEREEFVDLSTYPVKTYRTDNGYMDQKTFYKVMNDIFIPIVDSQRRFIAGNKHAVLIVDGHSSRYSVDCIRLLREHDIDLLVLPAHTSHVAQPLDLGLNHYIKLNFRQDWRETNPSIPIKESPVRRRATRRKAAVPASDQEEEELVPVSLGFSTVGSYREETAEETQARVKRTVYRRAKMVATIVSALQKACVLSNVASAWATSHLFPFKDDPPYTREKEEKLVMEAKKAGVLLSPESSRMKDHISGILTCDSVIERIQQTVEQSPAHLHKRGRPRKPSSASSAQSTPEPSLQQTPTIPQTLSDSVAPPTESSKQPRRKKKRVMSPNTP